MAARLEVDKLTRLVPNPGFPEEGGRLLDEFIRHLTGRELKTKSFMKKLVATPLSRSTPPRPRPGTCG
jgi:hypothetical protein